MTIPEHPVSADSPQTEEGRDLLATHASREGSRHLREPGTPAVTTPTERARWAALAEAAKAHWHDADEEIGQAYANELADAAREAVPALLGDLAERDERIAALVKALLHEWHRNHGRTESVKLSAGYGHEWRPDPTPCAKCEGRLRVLLGLALADSERVRTLEEDFTRRVRNTWGGERAEQAIRMLQWSITAASSPPSEPAE